MKHPFVGGANKLNPGLAIQSLKFNFMPKNFFQVENEEMLSTKLFKKKFSPQIGDFFFK